MRSIWLIILLVAWGNAVVAEEPTMVALVRSVEGSVSADGTTVGKYFPLSEGTALELSEGASLVVDFLGQRQERVSGAGQITVTAAGCKGTSQIGPAALTTQPAPPAPGPDNPEDAGFDARITRTGPFPGTPIFSWELTNEDAATSTPYQIRILEAPQGNVVWQVDTEELNRSYDGPTLEPDRRYYVQARTRREIEEDKSGDVARFRVLHSATAHGLRSTSKQLRAMARKSKDPQPLLLLLEIYDENDAISKAIDTGLDAAKMDSLPAEQRVKLHRRLAGFYEERSMPAQAEEQRQLAEQAR